MTFLVRFRRVVTVTVHLALIVASNYVAFWLRFDGSIPPGHQAVFVTTVPWLVAIRMAMFTPLRLFEGLWTYTSLWDLRNIVGGVASSTAVFYLLQRFAYENLAYPRSVYVVDTLLLVCLMSGVRLTRRLYRELARTTGDKRLLIYGAGDAGEAILRELRGRGHREYTVIGFVDDDPNKRGQSIHGVRVLGSRKDLPAIVARHAPEEVLIAIPDADFRTIREVVRAVESFRLRLTIVPSVTAIIDRKVSISQIRTLHVEDLLPRAPVGLDTSRVAGLLEGKRVLVTGAGGSIGTELCRQIAESRPASLVLFDRYENGLHDISTELADRKVLCELHTVVGDMTDERTVEDVFCRHRPHVVFHAAAHKHVPLMESNVCEAVRNNVRGSRLLVEAAAQYETERFVLISSDKAVNPTSIMGATKRVAEALVRESAKGNRTGRFVTVRFGNVLGSNGSVLPRFLKQIHAGGPVTVTHPDITRYFMLIPEAVQLVLHAASLGERASTYVLDMGEQIRVLDLVRQLIALCGYVPDEDIPITFVGLRQGEKLYEDLAEADERLEPTAINKVIKIASNGGPAPALFTGYLVAQLEEAARRGDADLVKRLLKELVPTFEPISSVPVEAGMVTALSDAVQGERGPWTSSPAI